ncbi:aminodeoxychorismate lyase [Vibrio rarus]|uniref:aminodeoxychorismate lyase n=1 Tax=Vibrio rarus TaxID=413403 RepID=UPI0021C3A74C|nr:aminodeoxychorismate lyase [Vibrio rarus]
MYWINGELQDTILASDRSFNYGDGGFTTMKTCDGQAIHWSLHVQRMQSCLQLLHIPCPNWDNVRLWVETAAHAQGDGGIKLHISRGSGGRGYSPLGADEPQVTISNFAYPSHYTDWQRHGIELGVAQPRLGLNPLLAGHKHNNRLEQVLIKADLERQGYSDGIVLDLNHHVVETSMANLFWVKDGTLYTPSLELCGVSGVMRRLVIAAAEASSLTVQYGHFVMQDILDADEVFMCNSLLGIAPIIKIEYKTFAVGIIARDFQERINCA